MMSWNARCAPGPAGPVRRSANQPGAGDTGRLRRLARLPAARCGNAPREPRQSRPADLYPTAAAGGGLEPPAAVNRLAPTPTKNTAFYIYDWLIGLQTLLAENAATESALGEAQRAALEGIVATLR